MLDKAKQIAEELRDKLVEYDDFIGLYLYGSQVTEKTTGDSDIDIMAIFENNKDFDNTISDKVVDLFIRHGEVIDFQRSTLKDLNLHWTYFDEIKKGLYYAR
ncbi:MAG: nucleotidyltransferase domain-containing protein [Thermoguttaceae bacterium]